MTRLPKEDQPPATPDPPDTRQTAPPTVSYRHPDFSPGPGAAVAALPPGAARAEGTARVTASVTELSITTKSTTNPLQDMVGGDINTTQRSTDEPISTPRLRRDDGRTSRLEEQLTLLDARLRLLNKTHERVERLAWLVGPDFRAARARLDAVSLTFSAPSAPAVQRGLNCARNTVVIAGYYFVF